MDLGIDKMDGGSVIQRKPWGDLSIEQKLMVRGTTLDFAIVVGTATSRKEPKAVKGTKLARERIGHAVFEPADRSGTDPR